MVRASRVCSASGSDASTILRNAMKGMFIARAGELHRLRGARSRKLVLFLILRCLAAPVVLQVVGLPIAVDLVPTEPVESYMCGRSMCSAILRPPVVTVVERYAHEVLGGVGERSMHRQCREEQCVADFEIGTGQCPESSGCVAFSSST